ncbi:TonB-dependent receptor [Salmonella enterica]|nr:TonB-dependent receptor [Salmonella enterica]EHW6438491.1 TonB-dependent receptor [Salmonella enterica]
MNTRNIRHRFRLNGMTLALAVALPAILASQTVCAETKADARTSNTQKATKSQKEETIQVIASPGDYSATSTLKAPVSTGALGTASALDTPFSVSTVTEKDIQDKQISSARDIFLDDASVTSRNASYSNFGSQFFVRGISSGWNAYINGMPVTSVSQETSPEMFERVDVLKGATGFMYGFGEPGGVMNYVLKQPTKETKLDITTGYRRIGVFSQSIDAGGRGGADDRFGFRLNLVNEKGSLPVRDARISRQSIGLGLEAKLVPDATLYGNLIYGKRYIKNPSASSFNISQFSSEGGRLPSTVRINKLQAHVGDGLIDDRSLFSQAGVKWDLTDNWKIQTDYVFQKNEEHFVSPTPFLTNRDGDYNMKVYDNKIFNINQVVQSLVQGRVDTWFIGHEITAGIFGRTYKSARSSDAFFGEIGQGNIFESTKIDYHKKSMSSPSSYDKTTEHALFISDRIIFNENWEFLTGIRHTKYKQNSVSRPEDYNKTVNTPTLALIFKPEASTSIYTSYVEALEQGAVVGQQFKNANTMLPPLKSKQYEIGVKTDQNRWSATAALFRIERGAEYANADNMWVQDGEERYQGLELAGKVIISKNVDLSASTMWLDPTYRNVAPSKNIEGKTVAGVPRFQSIVELG